MVMDSFMLSFQRLGIWRPLDAWGATSELVAQESRVKIGRKLPKTIPKLEFIYKWLKTFP